MGVLIAKETHLLKGKGHLKVEMSEIVSNRRILTGFQNPPPALLAAIIAL